MLAVQLPMKTTGTTKRRAKPVVNSVNTRAAMTPTSTQVTRETTRVATAKVRNRRIGRPASAVWAARKDYTGQPVISRSRQL
jgi:hypothetical protein